MNQLTLPQGRRLTKQRQVILNDLMKKRCHLTAFEVYHGVRKKMPNISLGTVYRNLKFLQKEGYIAGILCDACAPEYFEGHTDHYQHFICRECKKVFDLKPNIIKEIKFKDGKNNHKLVNGNLIENYHLNLTGICFQCLKKKKK